ncbi:hypothetical protein OU415_32580 [Saccharopolyspora sp. WRP15-2]|uniref:Uncharacterized protein n=1 Tax=Saccharopolyspora oryzae TaxID=2997343 RepID=A0ABT4V9V4_9PSEU|nr:hypothetical protein [Saccharopolyspora oryzae]MDA3630204.1 hypothetical protein [Saccharopolyspora oryzae]
MAAEAWRWTAGRVSAVVVPWLLMAGGLALAKVDRDSGLAWAGLIVGLIAAIYSSFYWGKFSNSDGIAKVRLSPLAWIARIICHALTLFYLFAAAVFFFV